jgi:hypothetical protein
VVEGFRGGFVAAIIGYATDIMFGAMFEAFKVFNSVIPFYVTLRSFTPPIKLTARSNGTAMSSSNSTTATFEVKVKPCSWGIKRFSMLIIKQKPSCQTALRMGSK